MGAPNALLCDPRFGRLTERLWRLGPRPTAELLLEATSGRDLLEALEAYAELDPITVARVEARDWPPPPIRRVA